VSLDLSLLNEPQKAGGRPLATDRCLFWRGRATGKTRVLVYRIARLIQAGVPADRILAVTFTTRPPPRCAGASRSSAPARAPWVWAHTFHAFACRLLRQHHAALNLPRHFTIYDQDDQKSSSRRR